MGGLYIHAVERDNCFSSQTEQFQGCQLWEATGMLQLGCMCHPQGVVIPLPTFWKPLQAGFQSLSEQMKMLLSIYFISLLKTELFQAMEISSLLLFHKKNVGSPSFGLLVTATITTHSNIILAWIHVLLCDSLFTDINKRECLLHHPVGISGIKKSWVFFGFFLLPFFLLIFFFSNIKRNGFLSSSTMQASEGVDFFNSVI